MRIRGGQTDAYSGMKNKNEALIDRQMCACVWMNVDFVCEFLMRRWLLNTPECYIKFFNFTTHKQSLNETTEL